MLENVIKILMTPAARLAILGLGGIGKTSLALAALHDPRLVEIFHQKYFISCESVLTAQDLLVTMAAHLGLSVIQDLKRVILRFLADVAPCILVLNSFETPWEFSEVLRRSMEQFLSLLTEIDQLQLILRADKPLDEEEEAQMMELLALTDNLPLAINLLANAASFEGYGSTLKRYREETTGPTISSGSSCKYPPGSDAAVSDAELVECNKHIPSIMRCKSTLLRTSMAFVGPDRRLRVLAPIRKYMQQFHPPDRSVTKPLTTNLGGLLRTWNKSRELASTALIKTITANMANIRSLVLYGICDESEETKAIGYGILELEHSSTTFIAILRISSTSFQVSSRKLTSNREAWLADPPFRASTTQFAGQYMSERYGRVQAMIPDRARRLYRKFP
ncbi:hypothetical protein B0H19DRAFT_1060208 [Mycena capillaripes]|nr:hypothetical protein B0H19DRAFT_1060208 [Mycena capillaripes]